MTTAASSIPSLDGMPASYRHNHGREEQAAHGQIAARRGSALVHVERCPGRTEHPDTQWMCVVTDDRPGLLSLLSAGICSHSLDIQDARIYCRTRSGRPDEAIDLFSVRDPKGGGPALPEEKIAAVRRTIEALLRGQLSVASLEHRAAKTARPGAPSPVSVRFEGATDLLVVEAQDRPGLLLAISLAIFREKMTIVRSHVSTVSGHARDEFELAQIDGRRLTISMRQTVLEKICLALEDAQGRRGPERVASAR